ncbi:MAG TPA: hypothetical protein PKD10_02240 [Paracoccaceae bacterium]|nr:hypothetical protein [Paracoccaceae bacterium]HMO71525.1 hypothetical protein [Paracoccaceae bacterium]
MTVLRAVPSGALRACAIGGLVGLALSAAPASAQSGGAIEIELNRAEDVGGICRLTYVATNASPTGLEAMSYEVAVFDSEALMRQLLVLDFGRLPSGKTRVVQFDLADQPCAGISRILVNGAVDCTGPSGPRDTCRDNALLSTRVRTIQFN